MKIHLECLTDIPIDEIMAYAGAALISGKPHNQYGKIYVDVTHNKTFDKVIIRDTYAKSTKGK